YRCRKQSPISPLLLHHQISLKLSGLQEELNEAKQAMLESEKKLKFKEETAAAAMSDRDAAIKSLRLADMRASRLGERVEELSRHLEESDTREDSRNGSRQRYVARANQVWY
ncbi:paramyosin-like, partial [Thalictrum thalictroides]